MNDLDLVVLAQKDEKYFEQLVDKYTPMLKKNTTRIHHRLKKFYEWSDINQILLENFYKTVMAMNPKKVKSKYKFSITVPFLRRINNNVHKHLYRKHFLFKLKLGNYLLGDYIHECLHGLRRMAELENNGQGLDEVRNPPKNTNPYFFMWDNSGKNRKIEIREPRHYKSPDKMYVYVDMVTNIRNRLITKEQKTVFEFLVKEITNMSEIHRKTGISMEEIKFAIDGIRKITTRLGYKT